MGLKSDPKEKGSADLEARKAAAKAALNKAKKGQAMKGVFDAGSSAVAKEVGKAIISQFGGQAAAQAGAGVAGQAASQAGNFFASQMGSQAAATPGLFSGGLGGFGAALGPAIGIGLPALMLTKLLMGGPGTKQKEERRLANLARLNPEMDLSKIPQYNKDADFKNGATGKDLLGRAALYDMFGADADPEKLAKFGDEAIKAGLVKNRMGTVDIGPMGGFIKAGAATDDGVETEESKAQRRSDAEAFGKIKQLADAAGLQGRGGFFDRAFMTPGRGSLSEQMFSKKKDSDLFDAFSRASAPAIVDPAAKPTGLATNEQEKGKMPAIPGVETQTLPATADIKDLKPAPGGFLDGLFKGTTLGQLPSGITGPNMEVSPERLKELQLQDGPDAVIKDKRLLYGR